MSPDINPAAPHHLPVFVTAPGQTDVLFNVMAVFLVVVILLVVILYFQLHALPERIAHKGQMIQFEIVAVLALISLFTHNHLFWIAGLLLAFIPIPDFSTPLTGMADSLARMAGRRGRATEAAASAAPISDQPVGGEVVATAGIAGPGAPVRKFEAALQNGSLEEAAREIPAANTSSPADRDGRRHVAKERA